MGFNSERNHTGIELSFEIGRIIYDDYKKETIIIPKKGTSYIGAIRIRGKIDPIKFMDRFGYEYCNLFGAGYRDD